MKELREIASAGKRIHLSKGQPAYGSSERSETAPVVFFDPLNPQPQLPPQPQHFENPSMLYVVCRGEAM